MFAAKAQHFARNQHHFDTEHIVGCEAVFQAMHAARIFRNVATDGTCDLRRRIRRIIEAFVLNSLCNAKIGHARLHNCNAVWIIDFENTIEAGHAQQHSVDQWHGAAGKRRARTARHDANFILMAIAQYL
ncbi:hypothetical protein FQZ97_1032570 [compost metagenome]